MYQIVWQMWFLLQVANYITEARHISAPKSLAKKPIQCYDCVGCYTADSEPVLTDCPTRCCYTVLWTEAGETLMTRACAENTTKCEKYCNYMGATVKKNDPSGQVHECETCVTNSCNHLKVDQPMITEIELDSQTPPAIECYECNNCTELVLGTSRVECISQCCYTAIVDEGNGGNTWTVRGCAKIEPGRSCTSNCDYIKKDYSPRTIQFCSTCNSDDCNGDTLDRAGDQ